MVIRRLTFLSMLAAILFVQEEALTALPNIQLTFFLIFTYATVLRIGESLMIITVHVFLDSLWMGALNPIMMGTMFLSYTVLALLGHFCANRAVWVKCLLAGLGTLFYCWAFIPASMLMYHVSFLPYLISDLPFEGLLLVSTVVPVAVLTTPFQKMLLGFSKEKAQN